MQIKQVVVESTKSKEVQSPSFLSGANSRVGAIAIVCSSTCDRPRASPTSRLIKASGEN
ncbi:MAG: hypothetical protein F6J93_03165 [Oscillatoria sp. SIO1A7]|nr:hypothetical protein [Oscillatoria sp. SIO1A7]